MTFSQFLAHAFGTSPRRARVIALKSRAIILAKADGFAYFFQFLLYSISFSYFITSYFGNIILLFGMLLVYFLIFISIFDICFFIIPNKSVIILYIFGFIYLLLIRDDMISVNLIASAGFYAGLRLIDQAYFLLRRRHGMGQGDAKLMAAGALWIDPYDIGLCLLIAVASAVISASLIALFQRRLKKESAIPFGPHLAFSLWHCFLFALHS